MGGEIVIFRKKRDFQILNQPAEFPFRSQLSRGSHSNFHRNITIRRCINFRKNLKNFDFSSFRILFYTVHLEQEKPPLFWLLQSNFMGILIKISRNSEFYPKRPEYRSRITELNASDDRGIAVVRDKIKKFAQTVSKRTTDK